VKLKDEIWFMRDLGQFTITGSR